MTSRRLPHQADYPPTYDEIQVTAHPVQCRCCGARYYVTKVDPKEPYTCFSCREKKDS